MYHSEDYIVNFWLIIVHLVSLEDTRVHIVRPWLTRNESTTPPNDINLAMIHHHSALTDNHDWHTMYFHTLKYVEINSLKGKG